MDPFTLYFTLLLNTYGQAMLGMPSTVITLNLDDGALGFVWHMRWRKLDGNFEQFAVSDPVLGSTNRAAFVAAVNGMGAVGYIQAVEAWVHQQIVNKFGPFIGTGMPLPPLPAPGPITEANLVANVGATFVNKFQFTGPYLVQKP